MNYVQPIRDKNKICEIKQLLRDRSMRDWFLFELGINTGFRISDLLPLRVSDVRDRPYLIVKETKTKKEKRANIMTLENAVREYTRDLKDTDYLFTSQRTKKPITRIQAYRILNTAAKQAGLDEIGTHTLRKTFGYHFYQKTKDVAILQELFNHSAPSITLRYIGINQDVIDRALEGFYL